MAHDTDADNSKVLLDAKLNLVVEASADEQCHNLPVANEVAVIMLEKEI